MAQSVLDQRPKLTGARSSTFRWGIMALALTAMIGTSIRNEMAIRDLETARVSFNEARIHFQDMTSLVGNIPEGDKAGNSSGQPNTPTQPITAVTSASIDELLVKAEQMRSAKQLREAEIIVTRAVQIDDHHIDAWRLLAAVQREMSATSLANANLLQAAQEADRARNSANNIEAISVDPSSTIDPKVVLDEQKLATKSIDMVRERIDAYCTTQNQAAEQCALDAFHSSWNVMALGFRAVKNDRSKVVEGLKHLKLVFELAVWGSESSRTAAGVAYGNLKKIVYPEEWPELMIKAGFDPSSRELLRKSGLE